MSEYSSFATALNESGKVIRDFPSRDPEYLVHVVAKSCGKNKVELSGYIKAANTQKHLSGKKNKEVSFSNFETSLQSFVNSFLGKVPQKTKGTSKNVSISKLGQLTEIVTLCEDADNEFNYVGWGSVTTHAAYLYLRNCIAPRIDEIGLDKISNDDMDDIFNALTDHALTNGRTKLNNDGSKNAKNPDIARHGVSERLRRAGTVYDWIRENHPEYALPEIRFPVEEYSQVVRGEQQKCLPDYVRCRLALMIFSLCAKGSTYAFGAALEFFCGLRVAEAAAPLVGELVLLFDRDFALGRYFVWHQIVKGKRVTFLKRDPSYRYVPLTGIMVAIVKLKIRQLKDAGFPEEELRTMPFVSAPKEPRKFADPSDLSAFMLKLLKESGCDRAFMKKAEEEMRLYPDTVNGKPVYELSAHLLRRDFATRAVGHLPAAMLDAILGHANRDNEHRDYASFDSMRKIAFELEKCFTFELQYTQNPAARPICVNEASELLLSGSSSYTITNTKDSNLVVRGYLRACEAADSLIARRSASGEPGLISPSHPLDPPELRKGRLVCSRKPELPDPNEIN